MDTTRIAELLEPFLCGVPHPSRGFREGWAMSEEFAAVSPSTVPKNLSFRAGLSREESAVLSSSQLSSISTYIDLLIRWNARINLTAVHQSEEIVTRHFGESFFLARHLFLTTGDVGTAALGCPAARSSAEEAHKRSSPAESVIDVGSGAGFPGLPIKIWAPHIHLTLIESNQKKVAFLREVVRALTLTNVDVFAGRAADFPASASIVTVRAVERFDTILPTAARLLDDPGWLALLVGESQLGRVRTLVPELTWSDPIRLPLSANRVLIIGSKEPR
jgi:16S rRNA (guanine527-N7)-methyltransferase